MLAFLFMLGGHWYCVTFSTDISAFQSACVPHPYGEVVSLCSDAQLGILVHLTRRQQKQCV